MRFPTGGKAREPYGMIRCDSEADSIVWMRKDEFMVVDFTARRFFFGQFWFFMGRDPAAHDNELQKTTRYAGARRKLYKEKLT